MSKYRKIDTRIWNDAKFNDLSDSGKLVFFMLLTHPGMTALGAMRHTTSGLAEEMGWEVEAFREAFQEALEKGMCEHDSKACVIALPNFTKYNPPESPNVVKAWGSALDLLPECQVTSRAAMRAARLLEDKSEAFREALPEAFRKTWLKSMPNQEQEQEQEQEQDKYSLAHPADDAGKKNSRPAYPREFEELWQEYPKRDGGNPKRKAFQAYRARLSSGCSHEEMLAGVKRYAVWCQRKGKTGTELVKQAATFLGPNLDFRESWSSSLSSSISSSPDMSWLEYVE